MWRIRAPLLALLLMQVVLLASAGATAVKKPLGKQDTCNMKNHMIEYLRNNGVQIYERPQISTQYCSKEWSQYGHCCDADDLREHVEEKVRLNKAALQAITDEVSALGNRLRVFQEVHAERSVGNGVSFSAAKKSKLSAEKKQKDLEDLTKIGKAIINSQNNQLVHQQKCVAKINSVISKSACSICSGRSDDFFNKKRRLKISEPLCRSVLKDCSPAWMDMVDLARRVQRFTRLIRRLSQTNDHEGQLEERAFTMNLDSFITNRNLIPTLERCQGSSLADCSFEHVAALCEQFIHIQAPTYIESSQSQAQKIKTNLMVKQHGIWKRLEAIRDLAALLTKNSKQPVTEMSELLLDQKINTSITISKNMRQLMKRWINIKLALPIAKALLKIFQESTNVSDIKTKLSEAIQTAETRLTQIQNTIAVAALKVHDFLRLLVRNTIIPEQIRHKAEANWDTFCVLVENWRFPVHSSAQEKDFFENLEFKVLERQKAFQKAYSMDHHWKVVHSAFVRKLKDRILSILKSGKNITVAAILEAPPTSETEEITAPQAGRTLCLFTEPPKPEEVMVVPVPQCNPCTSPEDPGILDP